MNLFCFEQINFIFAAPKPGNPQSFFEWDSALQYSIDNDPINRLRNFDEEIKDTERKKTEELRESDAFRDYRNKSNEGINKSNPESGYCDSYILLLCISTLSSYIFTNSSYLGVGIFAHVDCFIINILRIYAGGFKEGEYAKEFIVYVELILLL